MNKFIDIASEVIESSGKIALNLLMPVAGPIINEAEPQARRKLLGSIFPVKLTFKEWKLSNKRIESGSCAYLAEK